MAIFDSETGDLVLRIVFDGPARSGKSTSIRALAEGGARLASGSVVSPEEVSGRTVFFDWLDLEAGVFRGRSIRCQILGSPGQLNLSERRSLLLERADAVVFVADSAPDQLKAVHDSFRSLRPFLERADEPPVGVVVQANKRDLSDAVPVDDLRRLLGEDELAVVIDTVATEGTGIEEAFELALRLALDRLDSLLDGDDVSRLGGDPGSPDALVTAMIERELSRQTEARPIRIPSPLESRVLREVQRQEHPRSLPNATSPGEVDELPTADVPAGCIWPPIGGRIVLKEMEISRVTVRRLPNGDLASATVGRWRALSRRSFPSLEEAKAALRALARVHEAHRDLFSPRRCLVAHGKGDRFLLWQILSWQPSLRDLLEAATGFANEDAKIALLRECARLLLASGDGFETREGLLPSTLDTVGTVSGAPIFVEFLPREWARNDRDLSPPDRLRRALLVQLEDWMPRAGLGDDRVFTALATADSVADRALLRVVGEVSSRPRREASPSADRS